MDALECIKNRRSVRSYTDKEIPENILKEINRKVAKGEIDIDSLQSNVKEGMEDVRENKIELKPMMRDPRIRIV